MKSIRRLIRETLEAVADKNTFMQIIGKNYVDVLNEFFPLTKGYHSELSSKTITYAKYFDGMGRDFRASNEAEDYLKREGYVVGSMSSDYPIGFIKSKDVVSIGKWNNLSRHEIASLDGVMIPVNGDMRNGNVVVVFFIFPE